MSNATEPSGQDQNQPGQPQPLAASPAQPQPAPKTSAAETPADTTGGRFDLPWVLFVVFLIVIIFGTVALNWTALLERLASQDAGAQQKAAAPGVGLPRDFAVVDGGNRAQAGSLVVVIDSGSIAAQILSEAAAGGPNSAVMKAHLGELGQIVGATISAKAAEYAKAGYLVLAGGNTVLAAPAAADRTEDVRAAVRVQVDRNVAAWNAQPAPQAAPQAAQAPQDLPAPQIPPRQ
jgi:hypothetical protein